MIWPHRGSNPQSTSLEASTLAITFGDVFLSDNGRVAGADPGFQVRGGALNKIAPYRGRRENFWGISCEKSRFYAKKSYFFQLPREARKFLRYFVWKITILQQKIIFFPILGGRPPPWIRPWVVLLMFMTKQYICFNYQKVVCTQNMVCLLLSIMLG